MSGRTTFLSIAALMIMLLLIETQCKAQSHIHLWQKQSETIGQDGFGAPVRICSWVCTTDMNNPHVTTTAGPGMCPTPP